MKLEELCIEYWCGSAETLLEATHAKPYTAFSEEIILFIVALSDRLRNDPTSKRFPDVLSLAFWCRKAAIGQMKKEYPDRDKRLGRGLVLHMAPSSIPLQFAYSLIAGLLAGNANVVRISTQKFPQADCVINHINSLLNDTFKHLKSHILICTYEYSRQETINGYLSALADVRLIWGGDSTIAAIEAHPLKPGGINVGFANRFSLCVIDSAAFMQEANKDRLAERFYSDAFTYDQKACSSPFILVWLGKDVCDAAQYEFWNRVQIIASKKYAITASQVMEKLENQMILATNVLSERVSTVNNTIFRIRLHALNEGLQQYNCGHGFFLEYACDSLQEVLPLFNNKKLQTVSYYGITKEKLMQFITVNTCKGGDRIVPIGSSLDFSLVWDGIDLITVLSRSIR